mgnify:CR=1 FL=1
MKKLPTLTLTLLTLSLTVFSTVSLFNHPLSNLQDDLLHIVSSFESGKTSQAFTAAMKVYISVQALQGDLQIQSPSESENLYQTFLQS